MTNADTYRRLANGSTTLRDAVRDRMRRNLTPPLLQPHRTNEDGETTECQICGEPADDEMGEFWVEPDPATPPPGSDGYSVIAHAQCGLDHGLETA